MIASISDRHLRHVEGLLDEAQNGAAVVRIQVSSAWSNSVAGQLLVSCLVNLLCRQVGIVRRIEIDCPAQPLRTWLPVAGATFSEAMVELSRWAVSDGVDTIIGPTDIRPDICVLIGLDERAPIPKCANTLLAVGAGWKAWVGNLEKAPCNVDHTSPNPLGPFLAAALAAGEVFKISRGVKRGRYLTADGYSLWSGQTDCDWARLTDGPEIEGCSLPPAHLVGAGAVGNNLAYILASARIADAFLVVLDDDIYDSTNLNRCLLAGRVNEGQVKVDAVSVALTSAGLQTFATGSTVSQYLNSTRSGLRADVAAAVNDLRFGLVLSCVDKGTSRQDVQGLWPDVLIGASTVDMDARTNFYALRPGTACLGCHNPAEREGVRLRELERQLRQLDAAQLVEFCSRQALSLVDVREYLSGVRCGGLGESAVRALASSPPREFSVGFVSLGAALLLAANLFRRVVFQAAERADMTVLNFLNGGMIDAGLSIDDNCEMNCSIRRMHDESRRK